MSPAKEKNEEPIYFEILKEAVARQAAPKENDTSSDKVPDTITDKKNDMVPDTKSPPKKGQTLQDKVPDTKSDKKLEKKNKGTDTLDDKVPDTISPGPSKIDKVPDTKSSVIKTEKYSLKEDEIENKAPDIVPDTNFPPKKGQTLQDKVPDTKSPQLSQDDKVPDTTTGEKKDSVMIVAPPKAIGRIIPVYPHRSRRRGHEGKVQIELEISEKGKVMSSSILSSSGHKELDQAAIKAATGIKFVPATENGVNVKGKLILPITFKLK